MKLPSSLSQAIRTAIVQGRTSGASDPTAEQLAEEARDALDTIEATMGALSEIVSPAHTERSFLALQLLRASCDHGRAMTFLLANNPHDMMGSALALHRAQIESFLRGTFYAKIADEDELADFFEHDKGPRRKNNNGKWQGIRIEDLAHEVDARISQAEGLGSGEGKLGRMVANAWSPLCGMVHGGLAIHRLYADGQRQIGCSTSADVFFETTINAVIIVNFSLTVACTIAGIGGPEENAALAPPLRRFHLFIEQHNARLRHAGLSQMERQIGD